MAQLELNLKRLSLGKVAISLNPSIALGAGTSVDSSSLSPSPRVCLVCAAKTARYSCPRCFMGYCSLSCFQNHNADCNEEFCRDKVRSVLELERKAGAESMVSSSSDDGGGVFVADFDGKDKEEERDEEGKRQRLDAIASKLYDNDFDVSKLAPDERLLLRRMVQSGVLDRYVHVHCPWWTPSSLLSRVGAGTTMASEPEPEPEPGSKPLFGDSEGHEGDVESVHVRIEDQWERFVSEVDALRGIVTYLSQLPPNTTTPSTTTTATATTSAFSFPLHVSVPKIPSANALLSYQVLGLLLDYVFMVRTLNSRWDDGSEKKGDALYIMSQGIAISSSFRPASCGECLISWGDSLTRTYQSRSVSPAVRSVLLEDVATILSCHASMCYALVDCWLLGIHTMARLSGEINQDLPTCGKLPHTANVWRLMERYMSVFVTPCVKKKASKDHGKQQGHGRSRNDDVKTADLLSRKVFFLMLAFLPRRFSHVSSGTNPTFDSLEDTLRLQLLCDLKTFITKKE